MAKKEVLSERLEPEIRKEYLLLKRVSNGKVNLNSLLKEILPEYRTIYFSRNEVIKQVKEELDESENKTKKLKERYNQLMIQEKEEQAKSVIDLTDLATIEAFEFMKKDYEIFISEHSFKATDDEGFNRYFYDYNSFIEIDIMAKYKLKYYKKVFLNGFKDWYLKNHDE